jgi:carboxyl-terminal processing protease
MFPERQSLQQQWLKLLLVLAVGALGACGTSRQPQAASSRPASLDAGLALLTFDSAWSRIAHTHYDTAFGGVDWRAVRDELRPRAAAAGTITALRAVIEEMLGRLGESHFALISRESRDLLTDDPTEGRAISGTAGFEVRLADGDLVVWRVRPDGPAADAGVRMGWILTSVAGRELAPRIEALNALPDAERRTARTGMLYRANAGLSGEVGSTLAVSFLDGEGRRVERQLTLAPAPGRVEQFGNLPPMVVSLEHQVLQAPSGCVGVIRLTAWMGTLSGAFDAAVDEMRGCAGIIIDLRGNPGGLAGMVMGTAGHFLTDTVVLGVMTQRTVTLRLKANPRRVRADGARIEPFAGHVAVLIDETSASTSEFFAVGLQGVGRARVFGSPSAGQALPAMAVRLPTGDVLMHVIANFTGPNNYRIEGQGVRPDVVVTSSRQDLLAGRDMPFHAAFGWITDSTTGQHSNGGIQP